MYLVGEGHIFGGGRGAYLVGGGAHIWWGEGRIFGGGRGAYLVGGGVHIW